MAEGLISQADYDEIKLGFVQAQKIKSGVDAGLIPPDDFQQTRMAFFASLNIVVDAAKLQAPAAPVHAAAPQHSAHSAPKSAMAGIYSTPRPQPGVQRNNIHRQTSGGGVGGVGTSRVPAAPPTAATAPAAAAGDGGDGPWEHPFVPAEIQTIGRFAE